MYIISQWIADGHFSHEEYSFWNLIIKKNYVTVNKFTTKIKKNQERQAPPPPVLPLQKNW